MVISINKPKVSVILPVYNRVQVVKRAIDSVYSQTYQDIELVIVDDGSTDGTSEYLLTLIKDNTRYTKHSNRSTPISLNAGLMLSSGDYITFIDSDDEYKPEHITERIDYFQKNPSIDIIHSTAELIGSEEDMYVPDKHDPTKLIHIKDCILGATIFGKRDVFFKLNGFKNVYSYDSEFIERAEEFFNVKKLMSDTYKYYRNSSDSLLTKMKNKQNV